MIDHKLDLRLGAEVTCIDGECGKLAKLLIAPATLQVQEMVVEAGLVLKQARVIPVMEVVETVNGEIELAVSSAEAKEYPRFDPPEIPPTPADGPPLPILDDPVPPERFVNRSAILPGAESGTADEPYLTLSRATVVKHSEGTLGKLEHVLAEPRGQKITHFVVRHGTLAAEPLVVPVELVEQISDEVILLRGDRESVAEVTEKPVEEHADADLLIRPRELPLAADVESEGIIGPRFRRRGPALSREALLPPAEDVRICG